jgi:glycosyltransferase involved in cell wall biosynthesis
MLLENPFPTDIRVQKEADALINAGHDVILLCPLREGEKRRDFFQDIQIIRFNGQYPTDFLKRKFLLGYQALTFRNLMWQEAIMDTVKQNHVDAIHVHDLFLVATAIVVKKKTGIPLIADLHENYPEHLRIRFNPDNLSWQDKLLVGADRWAKYEPKMLEKVDHIIVVVEEAKQRLMSLGSTPDKVSVISNTEDYKYWKSSKVNESVVKKYKDSFVLSYIGGFGPHRGLDTAVKAMCKTLAGVPYVKLLLVGAGGWYGEYLKRLAQDEGVLEHVEFIPWIPIEEVRSYIEATDIGLVPHNSNLQTEATVPHKLFQYMLFGKPVVVSNCRPLKRIVSDTSSGLIFEAGNSDQFAERIIELYHSPPLLKECRENAKTAASRGKYSWDYHARILSNIYEEI